MTKPTSDATQSTQSTPNASKNASKNAEGSKRYPAYSIIRPDNTTIDQYPTGKKSKRRLRSFKRMVERLGISGVAVAKDGVRVWTFIRFQDPKMGKSKAKLSLVPEEVN